MSYRKILVDKECPRCGSDYMLKHSDPEAPYHYEDWLYCPRCDTLFDGQMHAMVSTVEPYADFGTLIRGWQKR